MKCCTREACDRKTVARGLCKMHYAQARRGGELGGTPCKVETCGRTADAKGYCNTHYMRFLKHGTASEEVPLRGGHAPGERFGELELVERLSSTHWLMRCDCGRVFERRIHSVTVWGARNCSDWTRHKHTQAVEDPGYHGIHQRLHKRRGSASKHACLDCGEQAAHWSYDHSDPDQRQDETGRPYSLHLDRYHPRCVPCHSAFDRSTERSLAA